MAGTHNRGGCGVSAVLLVVSFFSNTNNGEISIHPTSNGDFKITTFEPAYNPNLNQSIPVPASVNRLVPDYAGTQYMHQLNKNYISTNGIGVKIEMQGTRAKDFIEARKKMGNSLTDEANYTWHHMDDFEVIDGKVYCTMQLVQSSAHQGLGVQGMAHSGSVAQWKAYFGINIYP